MTVGTRTENRVAGHSMMDMHQVGNLDADQTVLVMSMEPILNSTIYPASTGA